MCGNGALTQKTRGTWSFRKLSVKEGARISIWDLFYGKALKTPPGVEDSFLNLTFSCQRCDRKVFNNSNCAPPALAMIRFMPK